MIRIVLLILFILLLAGATFLYFWDIPIEQSFVEQPVSESVLRD